MYDEGRLGAFLEWWKFERLGRTWPMFTFGRNSLNDGWPGSRNQGQRSPDFCYLSFVSYILPEATSLIVSED